MSDPLLQAVREYVAATGMIPAGSKVLVAVSGGQDSCALLHVLATLRDELGISLHAAHLNHCFRGAEAEADATFVHDFAEAMGIECTIKRQDVPGMARRLHLSAQEAGRRARRAFLDCVADSVGANIIALGHTQDDQVETILLNILRGTGTDGLRGMAAIFERYVRPLLVVTRAETAAYCARHGIAYREDISNLSLAYLRNRLRTELLPELETYYNPEVRQALLRLAEIASEEVKYLEQQARAAFDAVRVGESADYVKLSAPAVAALPPALRRRVIRRAIEAVRGGLEDITFRDIERAVSALQDERARQRCVEFTLPSGEVHVRVEAENLAVFRRAAPFVPLPLEFTLPQEGELFIQTWNVSFRVSHLVAPVDIACERGASRAYLDAEAVRWPLVVRTPRPGDRIQPLGMSGNRKLQDIFTDRKVPVEMRNRIPVVEDAAGIVWVVGHVVSERTRVRDATRHIIFLEMNIIPPPQG
ncbi:MAG TPA: tRNA lysidine(34) synthetase TilS [Chthonomonadales bacterium]|nr:tRNA lysidine(34) synthetase TilS [Chthonomonadales bacterium]